MKHLLLTSFILLGLITGLLAQNKSIQPKKLKFIEIGQTSDLLMPFYKSNLPDDRYVLNFNNLKIKGVEIYALELVIRQADSALLTMNYWANGEKQVKKLLKQVRREYGKPKNKVFTSPTEFNWVWNEEKKPTHLISKTFIYYDNKVRAEFKQLYIPK